MADLWFKARYVPSILDGTKRSTMRRPSPRLPQPGTNARASVGPRPAFATLRIESHRAIHVSELDEQYQRDLDAMYPGQTELVEISFSVI